MFGVTSLRLRPAATLGERILKVDHAGEHGAISIYRAQRSVARWRAPHMLAELEDFLAHERRHRQLFGAELKRRGIRRCRSYHFCGLGGWMLGFLTGLAGERAIAATTHAVESVVLRHLDDQMIRLLDSDRAAADVVQAIIADEREHHERSAERLREPHLWDRVLVPFVKWSTESVIWLGMKL